MAQFDKSIRDSFQNKALHINGHNAYFLSICSLLAYENEAEFESVATIWGYEHYRFFNIADTDTQVILLSNSTETIIAFRGTESFKDVVTDAKFRKVAHDFGKVHKGFSKCFNSCIKEIEAEIAQFGLGQTLWLTGHSLGGALATMAASHFVGSDIYVNGLYTFGSPRVGNKQFEEHLSQKMGERIFRFVNDQDVVTRVPTRVQGYSHVGEVMFFDAEGNLDEFASSYNVFLSTFTDAIEKFLDFDLNSNALLEPGSDHKLKKYIANIRRRWIT